MICVLAEVGRSTKSVALEKRKDEVKLLPPKAIFGLLLIALAFWAGSQANIVFSLFSFLCFFVVGVTLLMEGFKKRKQKE